VDGVSFNWFLRPRSLTEQININEFAAVARKVITPYQTNVVGPEEQITLT